MFLQFDLSKKSQRKKIKIKINKDDFRVKESNALDYVAGEVLKIKKIKYNGSLQDLYEDDFDLLDGLIIPGGESTAISNLINKQGLYTKINKLYHIHVKIN